MVFCICSVLYGAQSLIGNDVRRPIEENDAGIKKIDFIGFDIVGGRVEYDITAPQGPNTTLRRVCTSFLPMSLQH